jgi:hypothetical protein
VRKENDGENAGVTSDAPGVSMLEGAAPGELGAGAAATYPSGRRAPHVPGLRLIFDSRAARVLSLWTGELRWWWMWHPCRWRTRAWLCRCLHGGCAPQVVDAEPVSTFSVCRRCGRWWR